MKINKTKKSHKKLLITLSIIGLVIISGVSVFAYSKLSNTNELDKKSSSDNTSQKDVNDVNYEAPTQEQIDNGSSIKEDAVNNSGNNDPTTKLSVSINSFKKDATNYHVEVDIAEVISTGSCKLTLTSPSNQVLTYTSDIQALSNYSTCKGFDVPLNQLGSAQWSISAVITSGAMNGTATGKTNL